MSGQVPFLCSPFFNFSYQNVLLFILLCILIKPLLSFVFIMIMHTAIKVIPRINSFLHIMQFVCSKVPGLSDPLFPSCPSLISLAGDKCTPFKTVMLDLMTTLFEYCSLNKLTPQRIPILHQCNGNQLQCKTRIFL